MLDGCEGRSTNDFQSRRCDGVTIGLRKRRPGSRRIIETELFKKLEESGSLSGETMARSRLLLDHCGILLRSLVDGVDGLADPAKRSRLLARRLHDRCDVGIDFVNLTGDFLERGSGIRHEGDAVCDMGTGRCDQALYLLRSFRRPLRQLTDLLGNDRKPLALPPLLVPPLRLSIERQKVSLEGNLIDDTDDVGNFA